MISDLGRRSALVLNGDVKSALSGRWYGGSELKHCAVEIHKVLTSKSFGLGERSATKFTSPHGVKAACQPTPAGGGQVVCWEAVG